MTKQKSYIRAWLKGAAYRPGWLDLFVIIVVSGIAKLILYVSPRVEPHGKPSFWERVLMNDYNVLIIAVVLGALLLLRLVVSAWANRDQRR